MTAFHKHPGGGIDTPAANESRDREWDRLAAEFVALMHTTGLPLLHKMRMTADEVNADPAAGDLRLSELIEQTATLCERGFGDLEE